MDGAYDPKWVNEIEKMNISKDNGRAENDRDSSVSSDSEIFCNYPKLHSGGKNWLFGRERPLHLVLAGGKTADILLWRKKRTSGCIFGGVTIIWLLFQWVGYHFITFICHSLILLLTALFLWSYLAAHINISPPEFHEVTFPESLLVTFLLAFRRKINRTCTTVREVALGKDLKKFLLVIVSLWAISLVGSWFSFLTLAYLVFGLLYTVPALYDRHEDIVDAYAEKALIEIKRQYEILDENVIQKLPIFSSQRSYKQH